MNGTVDDPFDADQGVTPELLIRMTSIAMKAGDRKAIAFAFYVASIHFDLPFDSIEPLAKQFARTKRRTLPDG